MGILKYHKDIAQYGGQNQDRAYGYFYWQPDEKYSVYQEVKKYIKESDYQEIGIITGGDSYDYPLFKMLESDVERIEHVNVSNATKAYEDMSFIPDCIVLVDKAPAESVACHGKDYINVLEIGGNVTVLK